MSTNSDGALTTILTEWQALLQGWALDGSLAAAAQEALIHEGTPEALQDLITQWSAGDFGSLPPIVLLSSAEMNGAMGAYAISTGTIYLNADWLATSSQDQVNAVLNEELGHYLDGLLNAVDTPGDEGEYFARLLSGETLSADASIGLRLQGDEGSITVGENLLSAEFATTTAIRGNSLYTTTSNGTWTDTEAMAVEIGGHLVTINDAAENQWITSTMLGTAGKWIGYYQTGANSGYRWVSGEQSSYSNWYPGYPDFPSWEFYAYLGGSGGWFDCNNEGYGNLGLGQGVAEIPLTLSITRTGNVKEGASFTTSINLSAGTTTNLANGTTVYWEITGITTDDLDSGVLSGSGVISNGKLEIQHALKDDGVAESEDFVVTVYSDPALRTSEYQIGSASSVLIEDTGIPFKIGALATDNPTVYVSGTSGPTGTSKIESYSVIRTVSGTGKNRVVTDTPTYTQLATYANPGVDGITYSGGASANTISAAGVSGDPSRPAFNGQSIIDGKLGVDTITGGSYRNWLVGGGIFSTPLSTATAAVDTLIGTIGATDVFDLRTSDFTADAYSATNSGSARINNYTKTEDYIVLAGAQGSYTFQAVQTTTGTKRNKVTATTGYQIFSGAELVATVNAASGTTFTGTASSDLQILFGQTGDPTETLFNGQQMFFG